jgi:hypothetical protein
MKKDSISAQIAAARESIKERPKWMKSVSHFSEPTIELRRNTNENQMESKPYIKGRSMTTLYKLVDENWNTRNEMEWAIGQTNRAIGPGSALCTRGVLRAYTHPLLAVLMNPIHSNFKHPVLLEVVSGEVVAHDGIEVGAKDMTSARILPLPEVTTEQRVRYAIYCALSVRTDPGFAAWADNWLSGADRSPGAAGAAWEAAIRAEARAEARAAGAAWDAAIRAEARAAWEAAASAAEAAWAAGARTTPDEIASDLILFAEMAVAE